MIDILCLPKHLALTFKCNDVFSPIIQMTVDFNFVIYLFKGEAPTLVLYISRIVPDRDRIGLNFDAQYRSDEEPTQL
jgi:hypothetical protein